MADDIRNNQADEALEPDVVEEAAEALDPEGAEGAQAADEALAAELAEVKDQYIRLRAEWDNYRKRTAAERVQERARATEKLVTNLLPVVDDMERAMASTDVPEDDPMMAGFKAVYNKLVDALQREGLTAIDPQHGDELDINVHQAVSTVADPTIPDQAVAQVFQKGYSMGDKILRPAMVVTATGGPKREKKAEENG